MKTETCEFLNTCQIDCSGTLEDTKACPCFELYKQLQAKDERYEELRQYHIQCYEDNAKAVADWIEKYNQVLRDLFNGTFCNTEKCPLLKIKEKECQKLEKELAKVYKDIKLSPLCYKCDEEECLRKDNEELRKRIIEIFACLIKANRANMIGGTLWVDKLTTLWDYIAQTLGIEGDQTQIEEQIETLRSKGE